MEVQSSQHAQVIQISVDLPDGRRNPGGRKICGEAPCGFSDAGSISKDSQERSTSMRKLLMEVVLCVIFTSIEVAVGIEANSLSILTDAAQLFSDVAAFAISLFSLWVAGWEATPRQSYEFFRIEILGALVSIQLIWLLSGILVYEAIDRIIAGPHEVNGFLMFIVAAVAIVVNIKEVTNPLRGGSKGRSEKMRRWNINDQRAYLHVRGDHIQNVGVMIGGAIIWFKPEWQIVDSICTLIFSVIVLGTTINMLRNILEVLMESTPREIDATKLEMGLLEMEEVVAVHELHIWAITVGKVLLTCHVKIKPEANASIVLDKVIDYIKRVYNISHVTIQIER